jgi:hypothetical protein
MIKLELVSIYIYISLYAVHKEVIPVYSYLRAITTLLLA